MCAHYRRLSEAFGGFRSFRTIELSEASIELSEPFGAFRRYVDNSFVGYIVPNVQGNGFI